ncbi:MAG: response regulator [Betaproteobacteria bacterium]|nr:response regulator [Betaproteobacteria bacterium]
MVGKLSFSQRLGLVVAGACLAIGLVVGSLVYMTGQYEGLLKYLTEKDLPAQEKVALAYIEYAEVNDELFKLLEKNRDKTHDKGGIYQRGRSLVDRLERLEQGMAKEGFGLHGAELKTVKTLRANLNEYKNVVIMTLEMVLADHDLSLLYSSKISGHFNRANEAFIRLQELIRADIMHDIRERSTSTRRQLLWLGTLTAMLVLTLVGFFFWLSLGIARQHRHLASSLDRLRQGDIESGPAAPIKDPAFAPLQAALDAFRDTLRELRASERGLAEKNLALEQKAAELAEARNEALRASEAKSQFLATVSHELRTPINGFLGMTQLLAETPLSAEQRDMLDTAIDSARILHKLIESVLDFSHLERGELAFQAAPFDLRQTVEAIVARHRQAALAKGLELYSAIDEELPKRVAGDPDRLRQILDSLLDNAVKFTHEGEITLVVTDCGRSLVRFTVHDSGIGVSEEQQRKIFELFSQGDGSSTRQYGGLGLGLTLSQQLARQMGGSIRLESQPGRGTTFHVELPLPAAGEEGVPDRPLAPPARRAPSEKPRLLIVEDNPMNRSLAKAILSKLGYEYRFAENGQEALDQLSRNSFDLIVMDCQMPVMDGYEASQAIRRAETGSGNRIPILAVTANAMSGDHERSLAAGMDDYLSKPYTIEQLDEKIAVLLNRPRAL